MMKTIIAAFILVVVIVVGLRLLRSRPQAPACLHGPGESRTDALRRIDALKLSERINIAEFDVARNHGGEFATISQLGNLPISQLGNLPPTPRGFNLLLVADGTAYSFSLKDITDPCTYAFFSDNTGVIYSGHPIR